ncbi:MAG: carboxyl transferase domain-containing protein [Pseudomonadota bacterium]
MSKELELRRAAGEDANRKEAVEKRRKKGYRTARENLAHLIDDEFFVEYGELVTAAQRGRRSAEDLITNTQSDGVITGLARINASAVGEHPARTALIVNDYMVLAGTQGYYHHKKIDRLLELVDRERLPVLMYTEGGGGRPGDTDVVTQVSGLDVPTFARWSRLEGRVPRIAVANGYCFAGNALLFGCADIRIATETSWIGMAGPAMIEAGGLGRYNAEQIGPAKMHAAQGTLDVLATDEANATTIAKRVLSIFQGLTDRYEAQDQMPLDSAMPDNRRMTYKVRPIIKRLVDTDSFIEFGAQHATAMITAFCRIDGVPVGLLANNNQVLAGAIDAPAAKKAARFLRLCNTHQLPVLSLIDTPGFMVGPDSETQSATAYMSDMFTAGATLSVPLIAIVLRKAYGLGAMAMAGGSTEAPLCTAAWPTGEFGAMGLEGAVQLGFRKELAAAADEAQRTALFDQLVSDLYQKGSAIETASRREIDSVIKPSETRAWLETLLPNDRY